MGRIVRVVRVYEKPEEDFTSDDYLDLDWAKFGHITNDVWPPQELAHMAKIDSLSGLDSLEDLGYDKVSEQWEIKE